MLGYGDLRKGIIFVLEAEPWQVLDSGFLRMQQRKAVMQTKIKNLKTGKIVDRNFQASDSFEEAEIERQKAIYIYNSKGEYWFHPVRSRPAEGGATGTLGRPASNGVHDKEDKSKRFSLKEEVLGVKGKFLKANVEATLVIFSPTDGKEQVIDVELPVKVDYKVVEAPPRVMGNTAQGGNKVVKIETGAMVTTPMFIETDDIIKVNTETGEYVERVEKN